MEFLPGLHHWNASEAFERWGPVEIKQIFSTSYEKLNSKLRELLNAVSVLAIFNHQIRDSSLKTIVIIRARS